MPYSTREQDEQEQVLQDLERQLQAQKDLNAQRRERNKALEQSAAVVHSLQEEVKVGDDLLAEEVAYRTVINTRNKPLEDAILLGDTTADIGVEPLTQDAQEEALRNKVFDRYAMLHRKYPVVPDQVHLEIREQRKLKKFTATAYLKAVEAVMSHNGANQDDIELVRTHRQQIAQNIEYDYQDAAVIAGLLAALASVISGAWLGGLIGGWIGGLIGAIISGLIGIAIGIGVCHLIQKEKEVHAQNTEYGNKGIGMIALLLTALASVIVGAWAGGLIGAIIIGLIGSVIGILIYGGILKEKEAA